MTEFIALLMWVLTSMTGIDLPQDQATLYCGSEPTEESAPCDCPKHEEKSRPLSQAATTISNGF